MDQSHLDEVHRFPPTQWSLVGLAAQTTSAGQREALGILLRRYLPALKTYLVLQKRLTPERADDELQVFVCSKVLEQRIIGRSDRERGKFRTFLLRALNNHLIDGQRYDAAARRSPGDGALADVDEQLGLADDEPSASAAFDAAWAREVIAEAVQLMRAECDAARRPDLWGVFEHRVLRPSTENAAPIDYDALVAQFGLQSPAQASNLLMTAKRMFARALRSVVGEYAEADGVDEELRDLKSILARTRD